MNGRDATLDALDPEAQGDQIDAAEHYAMWGYAVCQGCNRRIESHERMESYAGQIWHSLCLRNLFEDMHRRNAIDDATHFGCTVIDAEGTIYKPTGG